MAATPDPITGARRAEYTALDAFLEELRLCRPGLEQPHITEDGRRADCSCSATLTSKLPPRP